MQIENFNPNIIRNFLKVPAPKFAYPVKIFPNFFGQKNRLKQRGFLSLKSWTLVVLTFSMVNPPSQLWVLVLLPRLKLNK